MSDTTKKPMTRNEIISKIAIKANVDKTTVKNIITLYENVLLLNLTENLETTVGPIGKIKIKQTKERTGINPSSGQKVIIPAKIAPKFSFSKGVKEHINKNVKL